MNCENLYEAASAEITKHVAALFEPFALHGKACEQATATVYTLNVSDLYHSAPLPGLDTFFEDTFNSALLASHTMASSLADSIRSYTQRPEVNLLTTNHLRNQILSDGLSGIVGQIERAKTELGNIGVQLASESTIGSILAGGVAGKAAYWAFGGKRSTAEPAVLGAVIGGLLSTARKAKLRNAAKESLLCGLTSLVKETERIPALLIDQFVTLVCERVDIQAKDAAIIEATKSIEGITAPAKAIIRNLNALYAFLDSSEEQRKRCGYSPNSYKYKFMSSLVNFLIRGEESLPRGDGMKHVGLRSDGINSEMEYPLSKSVSDLRLALTNPQCQ